jgi:septal ring factor EnvC (AmiA/AmiB activator)
VIPENPGAGRSLNADGSDTERIGRMRIRTVGLLLLLVAGLLAGCGREITRENEQLKTQVATLQQENQALKGQVATLKGDLDAVKKQVEALGQEKLALEESLKAAEAKAAAKPGTKPPLKPRRS